jgi:hypothetical protein
MRATRMVVVCIVTVLALGALAASVASAAEVLELTEAPAGTVLPRGAFVANEYVLAIAGSCRQESAGRVVRNGRAETDQLSFEPPVFSECEEGSISGETSKVVLGSTGIATLKMAPTLEVTVAGPCAYRFGHLTGSYTLPGIAFMTGDALGKLVKSASSGSCQRSVETEFSAVEFGSDFEALGTELREPFTS